MKVLKQRVRKALLAAGAAVALATVGSGVAVAGFEGPQHIDSDQFEIASFETTTSAAGAGERADFGNPFQMKFDFAPSGGILPFGRGKKYEFDLAPGLTGNPNAIPTCTRERFFTGNCPPSTQVGIATIYAVAVSPLEGWPVVNIDPGPNKPAQFALGGGNLYAFVDIEVSSDGKLTAVVDENPINNPVLLSDVKMFGVPADHGIGGERIPFMSNPTNCEEPFATAMRAESFEDKHSTRSFAEPPRTGCEEVPFEPSMSITPSSRSAGDATGLSLNIDVPQSQDPDERATAHVKDVTMTFPEGMTTNSSSAAGLGSCAPDQFGYQQETPITCPLDSQIGTVEVETPILEKPLSGPVYIAKQNDNPFDSLMALYMAPQGSGVTIKLAGKVDLDPNTGRLTTTFLNNPQQPFNQLRVRLKDGPRAPLALPRACGTYTTTAQLTSWAMPGQQVPISGSFTVDQGCGQDNAFTPGVAASTANPTAGAFSPFTLRLTRQVDGQPNISRFEATLPEGLLAKLAGVPLCPEGAAAAADCPDGSRIGHTTVGVGSGPQPVFAPESGRTPTVLYLGGPYQGAPYSVIARVPAQAGPFDLGTVIVRNALHVDPTTTRVTAKSDPLPQFLQGIPITYKDIRVDVDRPDFTVNPTNCETLSVNALVASAAGQSANPSAPFGVGNCRALAFKPKLELSLSGQRKRSGNPALKAVMTQLGGQANINRVEVILPRSSFIDNAHINNPCTRPQFAANQCPPGSILGTAIAHTPLLDQPLQGNVYFRANGGERELPDLVAALRGPISVDLVGYIDSVKRKGSEVSRVRSTFAVVPDSPVSRFEMKLKGGKVGLIENSTHLCARKQIATVKMEGQNGRRSNGNLTVKTSCGKKGKAKKPGGKKRGK